MTNNPYASFDVGDEVEFYSGENGGCWKPGIVAQPFPCFSPLDQKEKYTNSLSHIRIHVGKGLHVIRPLKKCRKVVRMSIPIEKIPNTKPPRFRWYQSVQTPAGMQTVSYDGTVPSSLEQAITMMIELVHRQDQEIKGLRQQVEHHCDRIAAQSELLSKKAETPATQSKKVKSS